MLKPKANSKVNTVPRWISSCHDEKVWKKMNAESEKREISYTIVPRWCVKSNPKKPINRAFRHHNDSFRNLEKYKFDSSMNA
jgi:hypothetical protein